MKKRLSWLLLPLGVFALDALSKLWILHRLREGESLTVIPGFFYLTLGFNPGAIFGSFTHAPAWVRATLFTVAGLAALAYFGWEFLKEETPFLQRIALGLILGGAIGNGVDRMVHGKVVDFLDFVFGTWRYWTFNLADSGIVCGVILIGWSLLTSKRERATEPTQE